MIWKDLRYGSLFGSKEYCEHIKSKYISKKPDTEIPQKRLLLREDDLNAIIREVASALECNISDLVNPKRISGLDKDKRDILIY